MPPRAGPEAKLPWRDVPPPVRALAADGLGSPVARAVRAYGGYAPSATYRLRLADGRRAFFKGIHSASNDHMRAALAVEERAYRDLEEYIGRWSPRLLGAFRSADWHVLLLDDLGPPTAPPWRGTDLRAVSHGLAELHHHSLGRDLPPWLPRDKHLSFASTWDQLADEGGLERLTAVAASVSDGGLRREVATWLARHWMVLRDSGRRLADAPQPHALLHFDVRSDNLRVLDGQLRLFDWNWAAVGPAEFDLAAFAQSVTVERGGDPEVVIALYAQRLELRDDLVTSSVASIAPYMLKGFLAPEEPGLPRLRAFQRLQAVVTLEWAARRLGLEPPTWIRPLADGFQAAPESSESVTGPPLP